MTTALGARPQPPSTHGRHSAAWRSAKRKRTAEKVLVAVVLFVALAVTVVLLGLQWLGNQSANSAITRTSHTLISPYLVSEVHSS